MAEISWVAFRVGAEVVRVPSGGIVGRLSTAALRLDDSRVSEAHALVSHRGRRLELLALRRWFEVDGERSSGVALRAGQRIRLAPGVVIEVEEVHLASEALAADGVELESGVYSVLRRDGDIVVEAGYVEPAHGHLWSTGTGWSARVDDGEPVVLRPGVVLEVDGHALRITALPVAPAPSTVGDSRLDPAIRLVLRHDTVHLFRPGRPPVVLGGVPARIVTEVALLGAPAPWHVPAQEIWRSEDKLHVVRQNWDRNNRTLRRKLSEAGIRTDLVRADGRGNVELFLLPGDELVDET